MYAGTAGQKRAGTGSKDKNGQQKEQNLYLESVPESTDE